jgi:hypothetical protein
MSNSIRLFKPSINHFLLGCNIRRVSCPLAIRINRNEVSFYEAPDSTTTHLASISRHSSHLLKICGQAEHQTAQLHFYNHTTHSQPQVARGEDGRSLSLNVH